MRVDEWEEAVAKQGLGFPVAADNLLNAFDRVQACCARLVCILNMAIIFHHSSLIAWTSPMFVCILNSCFDSGRKSSLEILLQHATKVLEGAKTLGTLEPWHPRQIHVFLCSLELLCKCFDEMRARKYNFVLQKTVDRMIYNGEECFVHKLNELIGGGKLSLGSTREWVSNAAR